MVEAHRLKAEAVVDFYSSDSEKGISGSIALQNRTRFGANEMTRAKKKSLFTKIIEGLCEPMMIILFVALTITIVVNLVNVFKGQEFDYIECAGMVAAIVLSITISIVMEGRSEKAFEALKKISGSLKIKVIRSGKVTTILQSEIVAGDILKFETGDKIPVDCRLVLSNNFEVDESPLTGESNPVKKDYSFICQGENLPLAERKNMVYAGCFVTQGSATCVVVAVGDSTEIGKIGKELSVSKALKTPLMSKLDKLGKIIAVLGASAAAFVMVFQLVVLGVNGQLNFNSFQDVLVTSITLIVASVPEGLPTIVAVSLALNVIKMAKENALVRKMVACETIGSISVICSDKTGTLTENKMTVQNISTVRGIIEPKNLHDEFLLKNFAVNSTAEVELTENKSEKFIGNPTECALLCAYMKASPPLSYSEVRRMAKTEYVYSFSSQTKRMTTILREKNALTAYCKGAPEIVIELCEMDAVQKRRILSEIEGFQLQAKRVIAFAHGNVNKTNYETNRQNVENNLIFDGYAVISDPIRKEVYAAVNECRLAGVGVKMLTGDNIATAAAIAKELKIISSEKEVFHAGQIELMSDRELRDRVDKIKVVARSTPLTKLRIVKALQDAGEVVAVTGDGINDAPAIKSADVGIAMGIAGTEVSKEAADIVLLDDSFSTIVTSLEWGRSIYENFQRFIMFQLTVNLSAVLITIICAFIGMSSPFYPLQLLWINLLMDGPPALTLGLEPMHGDLMKRRPTKRNETIVTKTMLGRIIANGVFMTAVIILQALSNFLNVRSDKERTVIFTLFIIFQLFNAFNSRELREKSMLKGILKNRLMFVVILITFILQIAITQFGTAVFHTVPLNFKEWLRVMGLAASVILFNEAYKFIISMYKKRPSRRQNIQRKSYAYA